MSPAPTAARAMSPAPTAARAGRHDPSLAPHEPAPLALEALHRHPVVPVVGRLVTDPLGHRAPPGSDRGVAGHAGDAAGLGQQVGRPDHHLRRHAAPIRTLATQQLALDPYHLQARLGQAPRNILAARAHPDHHHIRAQHVSHWRPSCSSSHGHCREPAPAMPCSWESLGLGELLPAAMDRSVDRVHAHRVTELWPGRTPESLKEEQ
jgi:hypothetical protein